MWNIKFHFFALFLPQKIQYRHLIPAPVDQTSASAWSYKHVLITCQKWIKYIVACEPKLRSVVRSYMHPCLGNWVAIGRAVVYHARGDQAFRAGIKCRHFKLRGKSWLTSCKWCKNWTSRGIPPPIPKSMVTISHACPGLEPRHGEISWIENEPGGKKFHENVHVSNRTNSIHACSKTPKSRFLRCIFHEGILVKLVEENKFTKILVTIVLQIVFQ